MNTDWGYCEENGPQTWPRCFPEAAGARQSPIDIKPVDASVTDTMHKLRWNYVAENVIDITNPGYCWKIHVNGTGSELVGGPLDGKYVLEQFHCHWGETNDRGSEHTVDGRSFAGELHFVHWNATKYSSFAEAAKKPDGLAVLGVFLEHGRKHSEIEKIVHYVKSVQFKNQTAKITHPIDPSKIIPTNSSYFTYLGSLTTPPCSECVIWIVFREPIQISHDQLEAFRNLKSYCLEEHCPCDEFKGFVKSNFRPTLPLGKREVKECRQ